MAMVLASRRLQEVDDRIAVMGVHLVLPEHILIVLLVMSSSALATTR